VRTLYICYLSLGEPLVQSQVLPYLRELVSGGIKVHLLTFEKDLKQDSSAQLTAHRQRLAAQGIAWSYLPYHKRPSIPATFYDVIRGGLRILRLVRRHRIDVLHARAHIPMAMALLAQRFTRCATIFDLRGLIAEEYVDGGIWKEDSVPFKTIKSIEHAGLRRSNQVIVLTERVRAWLLNANSALTSKITVIPCCVDRSRFADDNVPRDRFQLVYAGSVVGLYLLEEMGRFFVALKRLQPNARFRILTHGSAPMVSQALQRVGISAHDFEIVAADPGEIAAHLERASLGISFRKPTFSQIAASPTKIAEYLAAGIPLVSNAGTGDVDELLKSERIGLSVHSFDDATLAEAAVQALALTNEADIGERCRQVAARHFDLSEIGGSRYREVYRRIENEWGFGSAD
jgi:glycosyltransferase involved in cell wall biosynthesis